MCLKSIHIDYWTDKIIETGKLSRYCPVKLGMSTKN